MKIAGIQHDIVWEDPRANFDRLAPKIAGAAGAGARLVVLTEMFSVGFSMNTEHTAEPLDGPSTQFLVDQATSNGVWLCASVPEQPEGLDRPYNQCILAAPDGTVHRYAKIHPFTYAGEREHFAAGSGFVTVDVEGLRVTLFVCFDLRFADEFWATAADTDLYVVPANWPASRRLHWRTLLQARAVENQAYVAGINRVGTGDGLDYAGDSMIVDPRGEILAAAARREAIILTEVDPAFVRATREEFPFMADRR